MGRPIKLLRQTSLTVFVLSRKQSLYISIGSWFVAILKGVGVNMAFIMEFAENLILKMMEDPKERDRKFREHVYAVKDQCKKTKEMWDLPLRPYGFWTFDRHNAQIFRDAQISQVPGRRDPYDDLLPPTFESSSSK
ncbi:unnamed protein product [Rhodiola kirilowii]